MRIFTLEEHSIIGGFGTAVAECLADSDIKPDAFDRIALPDGFQKKVGGHEFLRKQAGLDVDSIVGRIAKRLKG